MSTPKNEDIFAAINLVGGVNNLKNILKEFPDVVDLLDSLYGKLKLIYHSRKEYIEFPVRFEIVGIQKNTWNSNSWPIVNLIYDDSNLSQGEKKLLDQFVYDTIGDLNIGDVDIKPNARDMFKDGSYMSINFVNGKNWESLDHDIKYDDNDIKNLHFEYYTKSYMNESKILQENEEYPTQKILNFLRRRYKVEEKDIGWEGNPILIKSVTFEVDGERYGISNFQNKITQVQQIFDMLIDSNVIEPIELYGKSIDPYRKKVIRTIKKFLSHVM